jgi:TolB-like protein
MRSLRWLAWVAGIATVVALAAAIETVGRSRTRAAEVRPPRTAIAVLPFRSLSPDTSSAYVAIALRDELLAQLAKVAALRVIGSASVGGYQQTSTPLHRVGQELGAGSIVEASVQVLGNRLRVIVQLVDPGTGAHLWAETYDRSLDDAFAVQSDIAQRIVSAVGVTLSRAEAGDIAAAPTADAEAYLLYLQGLEYARRPGDMREDLAIAQQFYERAVRLDPTFALAHAALSTVHARVLSRRYDTSPERAARQLREARTALRLAPDLPEAHVALALAYCCGRQSDQRALAEFTAASRRAPNDPTLWSWIAVVQARLGNWDGADAAFERARRFDPRDATLYLAQGNRLHCRRRYAEAIDTYRRALLLAPDLVQPHIALAWSYILWQGQVDTLRAVLRGMQDAEPGGGAPRVGLEHAIIYTWDRQPDSLFALLRTLHGEAWTSGEGFQARLDLAGSAYMLAGDTVAALAAFDSEATLLDSALRVHPGDASMHMTRGGLMATLGRRAEAMREVRWLERSDGYRNNHNCPNEPEARALILVGLGETDSALAAIERLLAGRSRISAHTLRLDPLWDPIRSDARFQALLVAYADPMAAERP